MAFSLGIYPIFRQTRMSASSRLTQKCGSGCSVDGWQPMRNGMISEIKWGFSSYMGRNQPFMGKRPTNSIFRTIWQTDMITLTTKGCCYTPVDTTGVFGPMVCWEHIRISGRLKLGCRTIGSSFSTQTWQTCTWFEGWKHRGYYWKVADQSRLVTTGFSDWNQLAKPNSLIRQRWFQERPSIFATWVNHVNSHVLDRWAF